MAGWLVGTKKVIKSQAKIIKALVYNIHIVLFITICNLQQTHHITSKQPSIHTLLSSTHLLLRTTCTCFFFVVVVNIACIFLFNTFINYFQHIYSIFVFYCKKKIPTITENLYNFHFVVG